MSRTRTSRRRSSTRQTRGGSTDNLPAKKSWVHFRRPSTVQETSGSAHHAAVLPPAFRGFPSPPRAPEAPFVPPLGLHSIASPYVPDTSRSRRYDAEPVERDFYRVPGQAIATPPIMDSGRDPLAHLADPKRVPQTFLTPLPPKLPGREEFIQLWWKTEDLFSELERLQFALRTVGACGPGIQAVRACSASFRRLRRLFGCNTASLFPQPPGQPLDSRFQRYRTKDDSYLTKFPSAFEHAAGALRLLENALDDYQSAYYESKTMYLLACLRRRFKNEAKKTTVGRGRYYASSMPIEVKRRIQALLHPFLLKAVEALQKDLAKYCEKGIPVISSTQKVSTTRYLNLTTIATFLSAVTATLLQITVEETEGVLHVAVNTFLFGSLTFSIASAINSLLAMSWRKSVVREPSSYLPVWITACLNTGPMLSLVLAITLFVVALCLFVFSSSQHLVTSTITVSVAGVYTFCLLGLASWLVVEKWNFRHVLDSANQKSTNSSFSMAIMDWIVVSARRANGGLESSRDPSQLERGRFGPPTVVSYLPERTEEREEWDEFTNKFLSGIRPSYLDYPYGGYGTVHRTEPYEDTGRDGEERIRPPPREYLGYAPAEYPDESVNEHDYKEDTRPGHRAPLHDDETLVTHIAHLPPVDSHTYETSLFLPRNEYTGELEEADAKSESGESSVSDESNGSDSPRPPSEVHVPSPPPTVPQQLAPNPMPVTHSEHVMVIPTNPPTYVVPPGSYVAYGNPPNIGPSTRAGDYSFYNPFPYTQQHPIVPPLPRPVSQPPVTILPPLIDPDRNYASWHVPRPRSPIREGTNALDDPRRLSWPDGLRAQVNNPSQWTNKWTSDFNKHGVPDDNGKMSHESSQGEVHAVPSRHDTTSSFGQPQAPVHPTSIDAAPPDISHTRSDSRPSRRTSSGSNRVRFNRPLVTQGQRRQSTADESTRSGGQSSTSMLSVPLTAEPEQLDSVPERDSWSRSGFPSSSLDSMQQRYRQTTSIDYQGPGDPYRSASTSNRRTTVETILSEEEEPRITQSSDSPVQGRTSGADRPEPNSEPYGRPSTPPSRLSTIDEATRSTVTDNVDISNSSDDSIVTAPETLPMDRKHSA